MNGDSETLRTNSLEYTNPEHRSENDDGLIQWLTQEDTARIPEWMRVRMNTDNMSIHLTIDGPYGWIETSTQIGHTTDRTGTIWTSSADRTLLACWNQSDLWRSQNGSMDYTEYEQCNNAMWMARW